MVPHTSTHDWPSGVQRSAQLYHAASMAVLAAVLVPRADGTSACNVMPSGPMMLSRQSAA